MANAHGAAEGLSLLDALDANEAMQSYQSYWAGKADMQARLGDPGAADSYRRAIGLESDPATRDFLLGRLAALTR